MTERQKVFAATLSLALVVTFNTMALGQDNAWRVTRMSGDAWVASSGVQQASLTAGATLNVGDSITTGAGGRVLLTRGQETILVSPNSSIGIPEHKGEVSTTIIQRAGTILLDVEKRNVRHFEVETPYLAAVVKGTQFRVTVTARGSKVDVVRGQVQVADLKTGKFALVLPGQNARVSTGSPGLTLGGKGTLGAVQQGAPRAPSVAPAPQLRATAAGRSVAPISDGPRRAMNAGNGQKTGNPFRITAAMGEVKLDVHKATKGLASDAKPARGASAKASNWSSDNGTPGNGASKAYAEGNSGNAKVAAALGGVNSKGNGGGNGNGNGGSSAGGNGNAYGQANGNGGGHGNGGHGNGNGKGKGKNR